MWSEINYTKQILDLEVEENGSGGCLKKFWLGEANLIFCCTGFRQNYFGSVGRQNNNNAKF